MLRMAMMERKSEAIGCCVAMRWIACSSIWNRLRLTTASSAITARASSKSRRLRLSMDRPTALSTMLPSNSTWSWRFCSSRRYATRAIGSSIFLTEAPGDVVFCAPVLRRREQPVGGPVLDQLPNALLAREHEGREVGDPRGLLHVVRNDDDSIALFQIV